MGALQCITAAIDYNQSDYRHYLNRCYCFLRMKQPVFALADAQYVIRLCTNIGHLFIANLRAGQAAYALQDYKQAEYFLKEATRMDPENYHAQRELLRVKISHIISLGFNEKDALMALQKYPSVLEAISYLNKSQKNSSISKFNNNFDIRDYNCDDMVFSSGDEEESENFETFNRMLNYQPGKVKILHLVAKPVKSELLGGFSNCDKDNKLHINLKPKRKFVPTNKSANDKAIWVGSLTNDITEQMLKKKFKQFGNVISVYRPCNEAYAFINFEKSEDVTNTLINTSAHEIAGIKLAVRSALRQK
ncbi:uncharacterized protein LOC100678128 [Nasonia vitripennis]|uniref:RRM domain-containing protein n=1 Tax=Nasonia vitripennis TaxID=7425 RepID=A0A7M7QYB2_NASVI|nr:uncharacterized protein LOC100678128 [Nasonia vitripennis]XP_032455432.1 uncharacterized protein LOC100678128 [Nasonia vitripennis]